MEVICIKPTTKLIKGEKYKVVSLNNNNTKSYSFFKPTIRIYITENSIQTFPLSNFKPTVGDVFPVTNWICPDYQSLLNEREQTKIDKNLKVGDYVVPTHDGLKTLVKGRKYRVSEVNIFDHKNTSGVVTWSDIKIKLDGSHRFYSSFNFRKCTNQEIREIGLRKIFDEDPQTEKVNKFKRKFDYYTDQEKAKKLLNLLVEAANDRYRHKMDIIDWTITKTAVNYKLVREDFDLITSITLIEILELLK